MYAITINDHNVSFNDKNILAVMNNDGAVIGHLLSSGMMYVFLIPTLTTNKENRHYKETVFIKHLIFCNQII